MKAKTHFCQLIVVLFCFIAFSQVIANEEYLEFDSEEFEGIETYVEMKKSEVKKPTLPTATPPPDNTQQTSTENAPSSASSSPPLLNEEEERKKGELKSFWIERDWTLEIIFAVIVVLYSIVYIIGSRSNHAIARAWYMRYSELIRSNFYLVGYGVERITEDSKFGYSLKTTGRVNCLGALFQLNLKRRQDLFSILLSIIFPEKDYIVIDIPMTEMPQLAFAVVPKNEALGFQKAQKDLSVGKSYSSEKTKLIPKYVCISDTNEYSSILRGDVVNCINNNSNLFLQLYVTDSHPEFLQKKILRLKFLLPSKIEQLDSLMKLSISLIDIVASAKLTKPALQKAITIREKALKEEQKLAHQQRQEAAERKKAEKEQLIKEKLEKLSPSELEKYNDKLEKKKFKKKMSKQAKVLVA